ncbi:MAG: serine hydrolase domain-containing protein [Actinomycetes bacterium]
MHDLPDTVRVLDAGAVDTAAVARLAERVQAEVDAGRMPAAQFALAVDGAVVADATFGDATSTTRFNVFSCTKAVVGGVAWQLIGEGRLSPSTRVADLVPGFLSQGPDADRAGQVTLEQLLTHTAGFPYAPLGPPRWATREGRLEAMSRWRLNFDPGSHYEYHASSAHWVVAEMVEVVEGCDYRQVVRDRVLEPLGLDGFTLGLPAEEQPADVAPLTLVGEPPTPQELEAVFGMPDPPMGEVTPDILLHFNDPAVRAVGMPGGGGLSDAASLARFYQALLHNPGGLWDPDVLADATGRVRCTLPEPLLGVPSNRTLGLRVAGDDGQSHLRGMGRGVSPRAFGHNGAAGQIAWADPTTGLSFAFVTSAVERHVLREASRTSSLATRAAGCRPGT